MGRRYAFQSADVMRSGDTIRNSVIAYGLVYWPPELRMVSPDLPQIYQISRSPGPAAACSCSLARPLFRRDHVVDHDRRFGGVERVAHRGPAQREEERDAGP